MRQAWVSAVSVQPLQHGLTSLVPSHALWLLNTWAILASGT